MDIKTAVKIITNDEEPNLVFYGHKSIEKYLRQEISTVIDWFLKYKFPLYTDSKHPKPNSLSALWITTSDISDWAREMGFGKIPYTAIAYKLQELEKQKDRTAPG